MLIYSGGDMSPFGPVRYKSTRRSSRKPTRKKTSKRVGRKKLQRRRRTVKGGRIKKSVKRTKRKTKKRTGKKRKLSAKNVKFLKRLGLRVKV